MRRVTSLWRWIDMEHILPSAAPRSHLPWSTGIARLRYRPIRRLAWKQTSTGWPARLVLGEQPRKKASIEFRCMSVIDRDFAGSQNLNKFTDECVYMIRLFGSNEMRELGAEKL